LISPKEPTAVDLNEAGARHLDPPVAAGDQLDPAGMDGDDELVGVGAAARFAGSVVIGRWWRSDLPSDRSRVQVEPIATTAAAYASQLGAGARREREPVRSGTVTRLGSFVYPAG
jgi:hypothetical protein